VAENDKQKAFDHFFSNLNYGSTKLEEGNILISDPFLRDPNFSRTVILIVKHNDEGSLGFVLNDKSKFTISEVVDNFPDFETNIFLGGPVGIESLFFIHTRNDIISEGIEVINGLYWGGDFDELKNAISENKIQKEELIFFVGYSGWDKEQLDREIKEKSWIIADITTEEVMLQTGKYLWNSKLKKLGEKYKILSNFPADPSLN
jgi:putative transcriptional regulator|tara:strand:- start:471 stop:1082 length:612 start_codon:yes stop_codon:yes gene_type:complete